MGNLDKLDCGEGIILDCQNLADEAGQEYGYNSHIPMTTCVGKYIYGNFAFQVERMLHDT